MDKGDDDYLDKVLSDDSQDYRARVRVVLEIDVEGGWSPDARLQDVRKDAQDRVRRRLLDHFIRPLKRSDIDVPQIRINKIQAVSLDVPGHEDDAGE